MMSADELSVDKIKLWIEEKMPEILNDFFSILRIRSVAEPENVNPPFGIGCKEVLERMLAIGSQYGFDTYNYDGYVGRITYNGEGDGEEIGIWCHLDVVDDKDGRGFEWEYPPYEPTLKNGGVIARGAQDNKSSAIMALYVLRYLKEHNIRTQRSISLYCGTCEEQGMFDLDYFTKNYPAPVLSLVPDAGFPVCQGERGSFNGELTSVKDFSEDIIDIHADSGLYMVPDNASIVMRKNKKLMNALQQNPERISVKEEEDRVTISFCGESIHAANPFHGVHALQGLIHFLEERKLLGLEDEQILGFAQNINNGYKGEALHIACEDELSGPLILVGTQVRMDGKKMVLSFISKYPVTKNDMDFESLASQAAADKGFILKVTRQSKAIIYPSEHPALSVMMKVYNKICDEESKPFIMSGGTYARKLPNAFAYGTGLASTWPPEGMFLPGHGDFHQPDESIPLERIKKSLLIYICSISELDKLNKLS